MTNTLFGFQYQVLAAINLHDDLKVGDVLFTPTEETLRLMCRYKISWRVVPTGVLLLVFAKRNRTTNISGDGSQITYALEDEYTTLITEENEVASIDLQLYCQAPTLESTTLLGWDDLGWSGGENGTYQVYDYNLPVGSSSWEIVIDPQVHTYSNADELRYKPHALINLKINL